MSAKGKGKVSGSVEDSLSLKGAINEITRVQIDGVVALKVINHCQEEGTSTDLVQGFLVGLVVNDTLEVTNCFPLPKLLTNLEKELEQYQRDMLSSLRKVNADYHQIGWYQSTYLGPHFTQDFLRNHFGYQPKIEESVVLIYDPLKTTLGNLSIRAFRFTPLLLDLLVKNDPFTPESIQQSGLKHSDMFEELLVVVRNSHLTNALLCKLDNLTISPPKLDFLHLSATHHLSSHMYQLIDTVDFMQQETYKLLGYERNFAKQQQMRQQFIQKRKEENIRRAKENEPLLPMDDKTIDKELNMKPTHAPPRQLALLAAEQVDSQCHEIVRVTGQAFTKLYFAEALQQN